MSGFGAKRTCLFALRMSSFDPKRTCLKSDIAAREVGRRKYFGTVVGNISVNDPALWNDMSNGTLKGVIDQGETGTGILRSRDVYLMKAAELAEKAEAETNPTLK